MMAEAKNKQQGRDEFWQMVRGICMLAVIMIHSPGTSQFPTESVSFQCWLLWRCVINFPVAVFYFLAGYFVNHDKALSGSYVRNRGGYY